MYSYISGNKVLISYSQQVWFLSCHSAVTWNVFSQPQFVASYISQSFTIKLCVWTHALVGHVSELFTFTYLTLINLLVVLHSYPHLVFLCVHFFMFPEYGGGALRAGVWCIAI